MRRHPGFLEARHGIEETTRTSQLRGLGSVQGGADDAVGEARLGLRGHLDW